MKKIFSILLFLSSLNVSAQDFLNISLESALAKAKTEQKQVLLYFTAKWCGPCKWMEKTVFTDDSVKQMMQLHYIEEYQFLLYYPSSPSVPS